MKLSASHKLPKTNDDIEKIRMSMTFPNKITDVQATANKKLVRYSLKFQKCIEKCIMSMDVYMMKNC